MVQSTGTLFVVAAPSGAGKTSLVNALVKTLDNIKLSISYTTRLKRPGEKEGVHYYFIDQAEFDARVKAGDFLEHAVVFGSSYGTSRKWVEDQLNAGIDVILEIDWQGAQQIRQCRLDCIEVFILPPSLAVLRRRLEERGQDDLKVIQSRMSAASNEISHCQEFDYILVNDDFNQTLQQFREIVLAKRLGKSYHLPEIDPKLLEELSQKR